MLRDVHIQGFKSIAEAKLELGRLNVFIGANGAGKSNFIEAIGVLGAAASGRVDDVSLLRRGVRPGLPALYKSSFAAQDHRRVITLEASWCMGAPSSEMALYRVGLDNPVKQPLPAWSFTTEYLSRGEKPIISRGPRGVGTFPFREKVSARRDAGLAALVSGHKTMAGAPQRLMEVLMDYSIFAPSTAVLRAIAPDSAPRSPVGLYGGNLAPAVSYLLRDSKKRPWKGDIMQSLGMLDWVKKVQAVSPTKTPLSASVQTARTVLKFTDRYMAPGRNVLSGYDASEGALYVLFMLVLAAHPHSPRTFAVDNFDQAMNPRLARALTIEFSQLLLKTGRQAILTTHNPLVLDGLDLRDDEVRLFVVKRGRTGESRIERLKPDVDALKQDGIPLSRLWLMGRLGGLPEF